MVEWYRQGKSTRALWQACQQSSNSKAGGTRSKLILPYEVFHTLKGFLTCRKILHGAGGFTSPPKEIVLWILIALGRV
jgi:hypothetical protein